MAKRNRVENTERTSKENPARVLFEAMSNPNGHIEAMEARGTTQLAESFVLPSNGLIKEKSGDFNTCYAEWAEKCGIKVLDLVKDDEIFVNVELPPGWKQERTDHGMWNKLLDDRGRRRAMIFYKAAFYDRSAHIQPKRRFEATYVVNNDDYSDKRCWPVVKDLGEVIWKDAVLEPGPSPWNRDSGPVMQIDIARKRAREWLVENGYPDYEDFNAYWD